MTPKACAAVVRSLRTTVLRCAALAVDDSAYCPVHRNGAKPAEPRRRVDRDLDLDVMPWSREDRDIFAKAAAGRPAKRGGRRG